MSRWLKFRAKNEDIHDDRSSKFSFRITEDSLAEEHKRLLALPKELLLIVVEYVDSEADLISLCSTCKVLQLEARWKLYANLEVTYMPLASRVSKHSGLRILNASNKWSYIKRLKAHIWTGLLHLFTFCFLLVLDHTTLCLGWPANAFTENYSNANAINWNSCWGLLSEICRISRISGFIAISAIRRVNKDTDFYRNFELHIC